MFRQEQTAEAQYRHTNNKRVKKMECFDLAHGKTLNRVGARYLQVSGAGEIASFMVLTRISVSGQSKDRRRYILWMTYSELGTYEAEENSMLYC